MEAYGDGLATTRLFQCALAADKAADFSGGVVDKKDYQSVLFDLCFGDMTGTFDTTDHWCIYLEHSDSGADSGFAVVTDTAHVLGTFADITLGLWLDINSGAKVTACQNLARRFGYCGPKRYCRVRFDKLNSGPNILIGISATAHGARYAGDSGGNVLPTHYSGNETATTVSAT